MKALIPDSHIDLLQRPIVVTLASVLPSGRPQVHPVWCSYKDGCVLVNSAKHRAKDKNMRERHHATVLIVEPENALRWLEVRGEVIEITEDGADEHIADMCEQYVGTRDYTFGEPGEVRVIYTIEPRRVMVLG
jgi:PPOX class probable F420-dependent enzyme